MSDQNQAAGGAGQPVVAQRACRWSHLNGVALRVKCELEGSSNGLTTCLYQGLPVFILGVTFHGLCLMSHPLRGVVAVYFLV